MATILTIRDGLKDRLATITAMANRSHDVWPAKINTPAALVKPLAMSAKQSMGGLRILTFEIILLASSVSQSTIERAQDALDAYLYDTGSTSIIAALEGDKTLGGKVDTLDVRWDDYGTIEISGVEYLGVKFLVTVWP